MAFFKRELSPVERFESALKDKQAARQKLADRLSTAETALGEKRAAAERLAVAGASNAQLDRAEANMRAVEDRAKTLRAALAEFDEQIVSTERALADAKAQRDRDTGGGRDRGDGCGDRAGCPGIRRRRRRAGGRRHQKRGVDAGSDQVLDQRGCGAPRDSLGCGLDLLGAADPPRCARARATPTSRSARRPSQSNRQLRRSSGN